MHVDTAVVVRLMLLGLHEIVRPFGDDAESVTVPEKPLTLVTLIVD